MARILLIDDHSFFRRGLEAALTSRGHEIVGSADNGEDAIELLKSLDPDLVLLDLKMRGMDGVSVLQAMRTAMDMRPVIVLTAELADEALVALMRASVNGIVFKHCSEERLFEAIEAVSKGLRFVDGGLIDKALTLSSSQPGSLASLNDKERQIAALVAQGLRNRDIAIQLDTSESVVKLYLHKAYQKLGVANRTELALKLTTQS